MINKQNRSKVFLVVIAILLLANAALLTFYFMKKDDDRPGKRPDRKAMISNFLKKEIGFSDAQLKQYDTLSNNHRERVKGMFEALRSTKDKQFKQLTEGDFGDSVMNSVADQSAASQKEMELLMFNHLKNVRQLCTAEQRPRFDSLFSKVLNRRGDGKRKSDDK